eukprot:1160793-Pelagomonas_calceolata.AAC.8
MERGCKYGWILLWISGVIIGLIVSGCRWCQQHKRCAASSCCLHSSQPAPYALIVTSRVE